MDGMILHDLLWAVGMALAGGIIFSGIGLISGTDETSTIAPLTLLIILLGVPPVAVFSWFMAAAISKHMIHAIPTALMGVPGDTMAVPMLEDAAVLRKLGVPHMALRKMISGGIIAASRPCWRLSPTSLKPGLPSYLPLRLSSSPIRRAANGPASSLFFPLPSSSKA